jgi:hypothetical protein
VGGIAVLSVVLRSALVISRPGLLQHVIGLQLAYQGPRQLPEWAVVVRVDVEEEQPPSRSTRRTSAKTARVTASVNMCRATFAITASRPT